jgi:N-acylneuraminate cytidylyltransferase
MTDNKKIVALIPARGGSKSIPGKNIKVIAGRPLIAWVIDEALQSKFLHEVFVATNSRQIRDTIKQLFPLQNTRLKVISRSAASATDNAPTEQVMLEFSLKHDFDYICLLQATSPLITASDIDKAIKTFFRKKADSLLTVVNQKRFLWEENRAGYAGPLNYDFLKRPRRQELDGYLVENGALYMTSRKQLLKSSCRISGKIALYKMPEYTYYELDEPDDFLIIENLLRMKKNTSMTSVLKQKLRSIRLLALDVDGVLTDGAMYYSLEGESLKRFSTYDGMGIELLRERGIEAAIITKEKSAFSRKRAEKLQIRHVLTGINDKKASLMNLAKKLNLKPREIAYMGDDVNDIEALKTAGFSACPQNAIDTVKHTVDYVCSRQGGNGAVREVCDLILSQNNSGRK